MTVTVDEESEERIVITVTPDAAAVNDLLKVEEALRQVLDFLSLADAAANSSVDEKLFDWRLESASTNSPFTVVAVAKPVRPGLAIAAQVRAAKRITSRAIDDLVEGAPAPAWMNAHDADKMLSFFRRNTNGVSATIIDFRGEFGERAITEDKARVAIPSLERTSDAAAYNIPARTVYGELEGRMVAVGRHYNRPAFQIITPLYGAVWCVIPESLVEQLGGEQTLGDVWKGKRVIAYGRLAFQKEGRVGRMEVQSFREKEVPALDLASILDPDFTAGLDPVSYLDRLHGGDLG